MFSQVGDDLCEGPQLGIVRSLKGALEPPLPNDPEGMLLLCLETWLEGHAVVVFCPTKKWCETLALSLARCVYDLGRQVGTGWGLCHAVF